MFRTRMLPAILASALMLPVLPADAAPRRAAETWATPGDTVITLTGHGYGHGHGLSQYGAEGAARQGLSWQQIVGFYYPGTTVGRLSGRIRVLISADTTPDVQVVAKRGTSVKSLQRRRTWRLPNRGERKWRLLGQGDRTKVQFIKRGGWRTWKQFPGEAELSSTSGRLTLVTPEGRSTYRGRLQSVAPRAGGRRDTVNVLSLESYLRGVVPLEVPALWSPQAVAAQSVAARTYAAFERSHPGAPHYDLCDTSHCQVYGGADAEHPAATEAIRSTARQGLLWEGRPAFAQFSASNGGWSSAGSQPYLVAQEDAYDDHEGNAVHTWTATVDDKAVERHWPAIGDLTGIEVTTRDGNGEWGGRVETMSFVGTTGRADVTGDTVRTVLGLRSEWFTFTVAAKPTPRVAP
jgi:SpoIID/LytB domain protein